MNGDPQLFTLANPGISAEELAELDREHLRAALRAAGRDIGQRAREEQGIEQVEIQVDLWTDAPE